MEDSDAGAGFRGDGNPVRHAGNEMEERNTGGAFICRNIAVEFGAIAEYDDLEAAQEAVDFLWRRRAPRYPQRRHIHHSHAHIRRCGRRC